MDGYEATKAIRGLNHPRAKTIPIIAVTADAFAEDAAKAWSAGMDDYITKPIEFNKLFDVLSKHTNNAGNSNVLVEPDTIGHG